MPRKPNRRVACEFFHWNIFERDGVFYADGRGNPQQIGKHSLGTKDYDEAMKNLRLLDRKIAVRFEITTPKPIDAPVKLTIEDGWNRYKQYYTRASALGGIGKTSQSRYRAVKDKHIRFCAEMGLSDWSHINKKSVELYASWLAKDEYSDATIYLECSLIKQVVKWLIEEEKILPETSRIRLKLFKSLESDTYSYSQQEVTAIIQHCRKSGLVQLERVVITLATTGMRIGELIQLRWTDIDPRVGIITLCDNRHSGRRTSLSLTRTTKGRRGRSIPITGALQKVLDTIPRHASGLVFVGAKGGALKDDDLRVALIKKVLIPLKAKFPTLKGLIGFEHGRLHSFRHYFISQAFLAGVSEGETREWVGHRDSRIVERYRHLHNDEARQKMNKIEFFSDDSDELQNNATDTVKFPAA